MSKASETFSQSILDAEHLLKHFNELNTKPPPLDIEVLKRAGLVMAMTAWETCVEDRVAEATDERLRSLGDVAINLARVGPLSGQKRTRQWLRLKCSMSFADRK